MLVTLTPEWPLVLCRISPISEVKHFGQLLLSWAVAAVPEAAAQMLLNTFPNLTCQQQCCFVASITRAGQLFILSGVILLKFLIWYQFSFQFLLLQTHWASLLTSVVCVGTITGQSQGSIFCLLCVQPDECHHGKWDTGSGICYGKHRSGRFYVRMLSFHHFTVWFTALWLIKHCNILQWC